MSDEQILRAAAEAIGRVGPHRITLSVIAAELDISAAALLQRFGSKRELLLAVARQAPQSFARKLEVAKAADGARTGVMIDLLVEESAGFGATPESAAHHLAFLQLDLDDPDFRRHALEHSERMRHGLEELLADAVRAGELAECDAGDLARTVQVAYSGSLITWAIRREGSLADALRRDLRAVLRPYRR